MIYRMPIDLVEDSLVAIKILNDLDEEGVIDLSEDDTDWERVEERMEEEIVGTMPNPPEDY